MSEKGFYKTRILDEYSGAGVSRTYSSGHLINTAYSPYSIKGTQVTVSGKHPEWFTRKEVLKDIQKMDAFEGKASILASIRELDIGGNFWTQKQHYTHGSPIYACGSAGFFGSYYEYRGPLFAQYSTVSSTSSAWQSSALSMSDELALLTVKGATAIARTAPTRPSMSLVTALGEIRNDGIPKVLGLSFRGIKNLRQALKAGGEEYLNVEFGWKPLIADIRKLCHSAIQSEKIMSGYEKGSGRVIGRSYTFPEEISTSIVSMGKTVPSPALATSIYTNYLGDLTKTVKTVSKTWFEGRFKYNLATGEDTRSQIKLAASKAEHLLGLRLTPEVLWDLTPWTWLTDWFFNLGDILTNVTAFGTDELSLNRAYIMCTKYTDVTWDLTGIGFATGSAGTISQTFRTETKMRLKAFPYGFGVTFAALSPRQIAILAALGITRGRLTPW
jgi:hypothetical protein